MKNVWAAAVLVTGSVSAPVLSTAATIESWDTGNVAVADAPPVDGETQASAVFDAPVGTSGAQQTGSISFTPPEAFSPGLLVENDAFDLGGPGDNVAAGCLRASSTTTCDGPFQSGKRFKQLVSGGAPMDLVFNVDPDGEVPGTVTPGIGYRGFHRVVNVTNKLVESFTVSLGFGIGDAFVKSTMGDGLGFSTSIGLGPGRVSSFSQYPFGLFGDAATNPNFTLSGFFDTTDRAGFNLIQTEDMLTSDGFYGIYDDLFGHWLSRDMVPNGAFWDNDDDPGTDALLMAWYREDIMKWEIRRQVDPNDPAEAIPLEPAVLVDSFEEVAAFLGLDLVLDEDSGPIEDLANLNLNYAIDLGDNIGFEQFTLRVDLDVKQVPIPLPPMLPAFAAVLGLAAWRMRRTT